MGFPTNWQELVEYLKSVLPSSSGDLEFNATHPESSSAEPCYEVTVSRTEMTREGSRIVPREFSRTVQFSGVDVYANPSTGIVEADILPMNRCPLVPQIVIDVCEAMGLLAPELDLRGQQVERILSNGDRVVEHIDGASRRVTSVEIFDALSGNCRQVNNYDQHGNVESVEVRDRETGASQLLLEDPFGEVERFEARAHSRGRG